MTSTPNTTRLDRFVRISTEARTVQDVETWVRAALDHGPNGSQLLRPVQLVVELELNQ